MLMYVDGTWEEGRERDEVLSPLHGRWVDTVPRASAADAERAVAAAVVAAERMRRLTAHERSRSWSARRGCSRGAPTTSPAP